jgi:hypothetical protein
LLNSVCLTDRPVDLGHRRMKQHFYQVRTWGIPGGRGLFCGLLGCCSWATVSHPCRL